MPLPSFSRGKSPIQPNRLGELKKGSIGSRFKPAVPGENPSQNKGTASPFFVTPKDESLFGGKSQVSRFQISKLLRKDPKLREQMMREFKIENQKELDVELDKIESRIPKRFGGTIDKAEAKRLLFEEYWNKRQEMLKNSSDRKGVDRRNKEYEFLKKKFGIK